MQLRRRPVRPEWKPLYAAHGVRVESWSRFLAHEPALLHRVMHHKALASTRSPGPSTRVCSWESSEPPKLVDRVQILAPCSCRCGRMARRLPCKQDHAGSSPAVGFDDALGVCRTARDPPKVEDQVRLLARALGRTSPRVCRTHGGLRSRKAGFDSRAGDRSVLVSITSSGCAGCAHDPAKVEDQVQFLARTWPCSGLTKHSGRRSLTAGRRSAKPQKRVRRPPAPFIAYPVVRRSWFTHTDRSRARDRRLRSPRTPDNHTPSGRPA